MSRLDLKQQENIIPQSTKMRTEIKKDNITPLKQKKNTNLYSMTPDIQDWLGVFEEDCIKFDLCR